jgi:D-alanine transaminase
MIVYFNNEFIPKDEVRIAPDDRGFLFADGAYEVIHSYGGKLFKLNEHLQRLERSLRELRISLSNLEKFGEVAKKLIFSNRLEKGEASIYIQITRGVAPRTHSFPEEGTPPTVYIAATSLEPSRQKQKKGVKIILLPDIRWSRCDIKSLNLLPNVLANQQAKDRKVEEAVFIRNGFITEGTHSNFCAIFNGTLVTHPLNQNILGGITRDVVLSLCRAMQIPVKETPISAKDLNKAKEMMILATGDEIMPVIQVEDWTVGDGEPGPLTIKIQQAFRDLVLAETNSPSSGLG